MLWTVQPADVWRQVQDDGEAWVDLQRTSRKFVSPANSWLAWQMRSRIDGSRGGLPWFAYCARPDLRWVRHTHQRSSSHVLLELDPPPESFISFPSWAWHQVFIGEYLPTSAADHRAWRRRERMLRETWPSDDHAVMPADHEAAIEASWSRLFSPSLPALLSIGSIRLPGREAVVAVIRSDWVRRVTPFIATGSWYQSRVEPAVRGGRASEPHDR